MRKRFALLLLLGCGGTSVAPASIDAGPEAAAPSPLGELLTISEIAGYQTVKVDVMKDGAPITAFNAPLITAKPGLFRVFVKLAPKKGWRSKSLEAELHLFAASERVLTDKRTIAGSSDEDVLGTTFNFHFDAKSLGTNNSFYVVLRDPALVDRGPDVAELRYPTEGQQPLVISSNPGQVKIVLVPVQYTADQSNRLPASDPQEIEAMRTLLLDMYPAETVDIQVRSQPLVWDQAVDPSGTGWDTLLGAVLDTRAQDAPAKDVYYVGAFQPRAGFGAYCQGGCVLGLAPLAGATDANERGALVIGYGGGTYHETVAHELGHTMGRSHAPCGGPQGIDPKFPYEGGTDGVSGYSISNDALLPSSDFDMMGYCRPAWISDYTYAALFDRVRIVNYQSAETGAVPMKKFRRVYVGPDGAAREGGVVSRPFLDGPLTDVTLSLPNGQQQHVSGHYFPYDHLAGGYVLVPAAP